MEKEIRMISQKEGDLLDNMLYLHKASSILQFKYQYFNTEILMKNSISLQKKLTPLNLNMLKSLSLTTGPTSFWKDGLLDLLQKIYPNVTWISSYFATVSFPSLFSHFIFAEYAESGLKFIKAYINDSLAHLLVISFLRCSTIFRVRLFQTFITVLGMCDNFGLNTIQFSLEESIKKCVSYLSQYHLQAILELSKIGKDKAIFAIKSFLIETVSLWKYSPLMYFTNYDIITQTPSVFEQAISNLFNSKQNELFEMFTQCTTYTPLPNFQENFLGTSVRYLLSEVDMEILPCIQDPIKYLPKVQPNKIENNSEVSIAMSISVLLNNSQTKTYQVAYGKSISFEEIKLNINLIKEIIDLQCSSYAHKIFGMPKIDTKQKLNFINQQRDEFAYEQIFFFNKSSSKPYLDYVQNYNKAEIINKLDQKINENLKNNVQTSYALGTAVIDVNNELKSMYFQGYKKASKDYTPAYFVEVFCDIVEKIEFNLICFKLSENCLSFDFPRGKTVEEFVNSNKVSDLFVKEIKKYADANLFFVNKATIELIKPFFVQLEKSLEKCYKQRKSLRCFGEMFRIFIEMIKILNNWIKDENQSDGNLKRKLLSFIYDGNNPIYTRFFFINVLYEVEINPHKFELNMINDSFEKTIFNNINDLRIWFEVIKPRK